VAQPAFEVRRAWLLTADWCWSVDHGVEGGPFIVFYVASKA
jgi:hypothetical protein